MDDPKKLTMTLTEDEHRKLKILAATKGASIKAVILAALDATYPNWRDNEFSNPNSIPNRESEMHGTGS